MRVKKVKFESEEDFRRFAVFICHKNGIELPTWCYFKPTRVLLTDFGYIFANPLKAPVKVDLKGKAVHAFKLEKQSGD